MKKTYADECLDRSEQATTGPWEGDEFEMLAPQAPTLMRGNTKIVWAEDHHMNEWDAEFCRHARTDVPELAKRLKIAVSAMRSSAWHKSPDYYRMLADELEAPLEDE